MHCRGLFSSQSVGSMAIHYSTGKRYKLHNERWLDERRNLEMSTEAAIKYLRYLRELQGDWFPNHGVL